MIEVIFSTLADLTHCDVVDKDAIRVPTFYAPPNDSHKPLSITITLIVATLFGGIHCAGWNFPFPSHTELIIWRVSSSIIVVFPCIFVSLLVMDASYMGAFVIINAVFSVFGIAIYVLARLTLFVEAFIALKHLPPGAYAVVEWTSLLLHM